MPSRGHLDPPRVGISSPCRPLLMDTGGISQKARDASLLIALRTTAGPCRDLWSILNSIWNGLFLLARFQVLFSHSQDFTNDVILNSVRTMHHNAEYQPTDAPAPRSSRIYLSTHSLYDVHVVSDAERGVITRKAIFHFWRWRYNGLNTLHDIAGF